MKIEIHIHIHGQPQETVELEPGPQGTESYAEHGDHDSTPRKIGFNADERHHDN